MALPATIDACRADLFTPRQELEERYTEVMVKRIIRVREAYNYLLSNPTVKDKQIVDHIMLAHPDIHKSSAYSDLQIVKTLLPSISQQSRDFHRWRYNEMIMETYEMAKRHKDMKTMERAATSYAKNNRVDLEDEMTMPFELIVPQPFIPTMDVTVLGLKPMPNAYEAIDKLTKEMCRDLPDIVDVEAEDADLEEKKLFAPLSSEEGGEDGEV